MNLQLFSQNLNELETITDACLFAVDNNDLSELESLLAKRKNDLEIIENLLKDDPNFFKNESHLDQDTKLILSEIKSKFKKIIKDNKILADNLSREKEKSLSEVKKLKKGKETLEVLRKNIAGKRIISKTI